MGPKILRGEHGFTLRSFRRKFFDNDSIAYRVFQALVSHSEVGHTCTPVCLAFICFYFCVLFHRFQAAASVLNRIEKLFIFTEH